MIEIAQRALGSAGHTITYVSVPWARAIYGVRHGHYDGIVAAGREETPDFVFPETSLGIARHTFFVKPDSSWKYSGIADLEQVTLGTIKDYSYGQLWVAYIRENRHDREKVQVATGEMPLVQNIEKLRKGRIDALIEDENVFRYVCAQYGYANQFKNAGVAFEENLFIAFSPNLSRAEKYAALLTREIRKMRENGELVEILERYSLEDWE